MNDLEVFVTHYGTATLLIEIGSLRLLTDPVFDPPGRTYDIMGMARYRRKSVPGSYPVELEGCDSVLLSHDQHGDNLDVAGRRLLATAKTCHTTPAAARRLGGRAIGMKPWQQETLTGSKGERVRITATPAQHGPWFMKPITGPVTGFLLEWEGQRDGALYISGDTVMFGGIHEVARRFRIGTAILHVGRASFKGTGALHYTFSASEAVEAARALDARHTYPIHYEGWSHFREGRADVERAFAREGWSDRLRFFPLGERHRLEH